MTPDGTLAADLAIRNGRFAAIAAHGALDVSGADAYDASGLHVIPGVIDAHVHFRDPGLEHKEDWQTGSVAAVMGGVTTVIDMPNTIPATGSVEAVELKRSRAEGRSHVDFGIMGLLTQDNLSSLKGMATAGVCGVKCFLGETVGGIAAPDDGVMLDVLREVAVAGLRIGFHAENNAIMQHRIRTLREAGRTDPMAHVESRPPVSEAESIQRMALFAKGFGTRIHIFHVSSADGLATIDEWRAKGVDITCETAAHYVFKSAEDFVQLGSRLRMNPPVRARAEGHAAALLQGLRDGRVDAIATDHAPHTPEEKLQTDIWRAASGIPGVETSVRYFLTHGVSAGRMSLREFVRATSEGPARAWGIFPRKGSIRIGADGDLTVLDLGVRGVIRDSDLHSKTHVSPYDGEATLGAPVATILRGRVVMQDGRLIGEPSGRYVRPGLAAV